MELAENKAITNQIQESASLPENKQKHETMTEGKANQGFSKRKEILKQRVSMTREKHQQSSQLQNKQIKLERS